MGVVPSAASTVDPLALDGAISCIKETVDACDINRGGARRAAGRQLLPIIPELFSIPGRTYNSQNYSGIISASLPVAQPTCRLPVAVECGCDSYVTLSKERIVRPTTVGDSLA